MHLVKRWNKKRIIIPSLLVFFLLVTALTACVGPGNTEQDASEKTVQATEQKNDAAEEEKAGKTMEGTQVAKEELELYIDGEYIPVRWEENESVEALKTIAKESSLRIQMSMYGGFEQVGAIGSNLPRKDKQTTTSAGDIVLYSGNQIVLFYGSNSWAYTRLGKMEKDEAELSELLGNKDVSIEIKVGTGQAATYAIPDIKMNSGYTMPVIGLGTWTLSDDEAEEAVYAALKCGMRLIDTARYYRCEVGVGRGIKRAIDDGIVTREEVFVTSKIMPSDYDRAAQGIDDSLSDLGLNYLDLMLIHQPGSNDEAVYKAMEQAVRDGKVRSIGISNYYTKEAVDEVLSYAEIVPAVIQNENHLYYQNNELQEYVKQYGIVIESWYPFGGRGHTQESFSNDVIVQLADKYGKSSAQIILRWQVQAGYIAIPGSSNPDHIAENYDIFDFELSEDEMKSIYELDKQERYESW